MKYTKAIKIVAFMLLLCSTVYGAFPYLTFTDTFTPSGMTDFRDFRWNWYDHSDVIISVTFNETGYTNMVFKMAYPKGGDSYLTVEGGVVVEGATSSTYYAEISHTNIPPNGTYYASFMAANVDADTNYTPVRVLAQGTIDTKWTVFSATNAAAWQATTVISSLADASYFNSLVRSNQMGSGLSWDGSAWNVTGTSIAEVVYGTTTGTAYRGDWGAAVSNTANTALSTATGAAATADSAYTAATQAQATADAAATGTPVYVESDPVWTGVSNAYAVAIDGKLDSNHWAAADSTTNYLSKTGDTMTGNLRFSNADTSYVPPTVEYYWNAGAPSYGIYSRPYFFGNLSYLVYSNSLTVATNKIWQSGNDGSGSGLDADLLDGKDSTAFATGTPLYVETYLGTGDVSSAMFSGTTNNFVAGDGTLQDFPASAGGGNITATNTPTSGQMLYASGTDNDTTYWAAAPAGGGYNPTNASVPTILYCADGTTATVTRTTGSAFALYLTNATQSLAFDAAFDAAVDGTVLGTLIGTNSLTHVGVSVTNYIAGSGLTLSTGSVRVLYSKPFGSTTFRGVQLP